MNKFIFSFYDKQIKKAPKQISCLLRLHDYKHIPVTATIAKFSIKIQLSSTKCIGGQNRPFKRLIPKRFQQILLLDIYKTILSIVCL